jgi:predicted permease
MTSILRQVRHAVRMLAIAPVFAITAIVSLAIGIGANTAIFTAANAIFLAPTTGIDDMDRLVDIGRTQEGRGFDTVSYPTYADLRDRVSVFSGVYALELEPKPLSLGADAGAERIYSELVSANYFAVLGLRPAAGQFFDPAPERVGVPLRDVVLTHAFWQSRYQGRADIIGQEIVLNGDRFRVVGVGPEGYRGTTILTPDVWLPLTSFARGLPAEETLRSREGAWLIMAGRLKPDVSLAQAQAALNAFSADLERQFPEIYRGRGLAATKASRVPGIGREFIAPFLAILMGVAGLVLLVTCTNLAGMMLARGAARSREIAVRLALGASRRSLVAMLMTEALVLSVSGALMALVVAWWMARAMSNTLPALPFPVALAFPLDWRVLLFTSALAVVTTCLTGLAPALQSARTNLIGDLKADANAPKRQRLRHVFITAQLAFCLVLVVMAGLFLRALDAAASVDPGFSVTNVDVATLELSLGGYTDEQAPAVAEQLREGIAGIPGVSAVGYARMVPLDGGGLGLGGLRPRGASGPGSSIDTDWNVVSPDFFAALDLPIVRGRGFTSADRQGVPRVAIVNERLARSAWPGQDAIGQILENGDFRPGRESTIETLTVIGVARDAKYRWIGEGPVPFIYVPYAQQPMRSVNYLVRHTGGPDASAGLQASVRAAIKKFDANLPLVRMQSLQSYADLGMLPQRMAASVAGTLGIVALLLAGTGIYGVTAFAVASRTKEIGLRIALGADRGRVMRMVLWHGLRLTTIGATAGLALSLGATQLLGSVLFGVSPLDPVTYGVTFATLAGVTLAGTVAPARRAANTDPIRTLKAD